MSDENQNNMPPPDERPSRPENSQGPRIPRPMILLIIMLALSFLVLSVVGPQQYKSMSFSEFQGKWDAEKQAYTGFDKATLQGETLLVREALDPSMNEEDKESATRVWHRITVPKSAVDYEFVRALGTIPEFEVEPVNELAQELLGWIVLPVIFIAAIYFLIIRPLRAQGGPGSVLSFGRSRPKLIGKEHSGVKFDDVAGIDDAKEEVAEVIEFLKNPDKFEKLGGRIPRGLLFAGPPGTGKTLLAKAIAGEADVPFYSISGSDFVEMFVGVGASRVRDLFRQAKENTPCIIFLDEVDAVGRRRGSGLGGGHDEREQTLNAILVEMDGFETNEQVIVIASTNRPDVLDPALLRPGRFDREVVINLPDVRGRHQILKVHSRKIRLSESVDLKKIARGTPRFSGAQLEALINEAAIRATMHGKDFVEQDDLEEARDKVAFGRERRSQVLDEKEREMIAFHEAGHAMLMLKCPESEPLHKVTIIPRGMALGYASQLPDNDQFTRSRRRFLADITVAYGGRIAEEIFCDDISTGARSDIERASMLARSMVCDYGMSDELGPIQYSNKEQQVFLGGELSHPRDFSEATAEKIDVAVRRIVEGCYAEADKLMRENLEGTRLIAKALLKHETLTAEDVEKILTEKDIDVVSSFEENGEDESDGKSDAAEEAEPETAKVEEESVPSHSPDDDKSET